MHTTYVRIEASPEDTHPATSSGQSAESQASPPTHADTVPHNVPPSPPYEVTVCDDPDELVRTAAELVVALAAQAVSERGRFDWALAGGDTPRALYALLASDAFATRIDWSKVHLVWGDERCVPPTDAASNYRMVKETLLDAANVPEQNVHRMLGELEPARAAASYEEGLRAAFGVREGGEAPRLDLVLLGMGADGHTASLFPNTSAVDETRRWVVASHVQSLEAWRLTLTLPIINAAAHVVFLVGGKNKAARLAEVLRRGPDAAGLPAERVRPVSGDLRWLIDAEAASMMEP